MRPAVNQEKLGVILRTSRRKHVIKAQPEEERIRMDFDQLAKRVRNLLCDYYLYGFEMEGPATEKDYRVAVAKEFVKRAYEMVDVKGEWDMIAYNWAHRPGFGNGWDRDAAISFSHATGRLFEKLDQEAPSHKDHFYAIQNIFDECYYFGGGFLAGLMFEAFDRNPEADLEIVRSNMLRYIKLTEMAELAYTSFELWDIIGRGVNSTLERALDEKVEQFNNGDADQKKEAWAYLKHFGYVIENE